MKRIKIDCIECGKTTEMSLELYIEAIREVAASGSTYTWHMCQECSEKEGCEDDEDEA